MEVHSNSKYTILIIDDVPENIQVVSSILYQKGVNIAIAQSGGEALKIISRKSPDLILLDIIMPEMDGFAVC
jgi:CheY-like chemotaxis protein